ACVPFLRAVMVARAWVCSQVLTTTASKAAGLSNTLRKSVNLAASLCVLAAASTALASTSQRTVMFSEATPRMLAPPRPPQAIMAMFSLSLRFRPRTIVGTARVAAAPAASLWNVRRLMVELRGIRYLLGEGGAGSGRVGGLGEMIPPLGRPL